MHDLRNCHCAGGGNPVAELPDRSEQEPSGFYLRRAPSRNELVEGGKRIESSASTHFTPSMIPEAHSPSVPTWWCHCGMQ